MVTGFRSSADFDLNGKHVVLASAAAVKTQSGDTFLEASPAERNFFLGEHLLVFGERDSKAHALRATKVIIVSVPLGIVTARGIVEATFAAGTVAPDPVVRAAGYKVVISPKAAISYLPPASSADPIAVNMWMAFHGKQQPDGTILADKVVWARNTIDKNGQKLIDKTDYDPAAVDPDAGQNPLSKAFTGIDPTKIPPYEDHLMQARISAVGDKLIPQYQRDLPAGDPAKIKFRFQLVNESRWRQPLTLGSGIILVPFQLVERMQNDSQLAALLAFNVAMAMEQQAVDTQKSLTPLLARAGIETAGLLCAPIGAGVLTYDLVGVPGTLSAAKQVKNQDEERLRVSLFLLHDAGYDIHEAPHAWWLLNSKKKDLAQIALPHRAAYLYQVLGTTWRSS